MIPLILLAAAAIVFLLFLSSQVWRRYSPKGEASHAGQLIPVDLEAFENLTDPEEEQFLRVNLSPAEFRGVQRARARPAAGGEKGGANWSGVPRAQFPHSYAAGRSIRTFQSLAARKYYLLRKPNRARTIRPALKSLPHVTPGYVGRSCPSTREELWLPTVSQSRYRKATP